jgi:protein O-GlcNAc transferase
MSDAAARSPTDLVEQGRALHREGRLEEAERLYSQALAADEDCAEAHQLMAVLAGQRGRFDEAIAGFRRTIALEGPTPDRLFNLAEAYRVTRQFQSALDAYNQVVTIDAGYAHAYRNCAAMVEEAAEESRASGNIVKANQFGKLAAHYWVGLGHFCLRGHDTPAAENAYRKAVALDPGRAEAYNCLGAIALAARRPIEAETWFRRAKELEPRSPLYISNLGDALLNQTRTEEAAEQFRHAMEVDPSFAQARINLEERTLLWLHHRSDLSPREVFAAHQEWGRSAITRAKETADPPPLFANSRDPERPLKIGYVGVDTGSRLAKYCLAPLVSNHDPRSVRAALYVTAGSGSADLRYFKQLTDRIQLLSLRGAKDVATAMRETGLDILIDVAGHEPHNRLDVFALKPAPVTISWLGYPDTTGLPTIDFRVTDEIADPLGTEELYTEQLYRLRSGSFVYRPPEHAPEVSPAPACTSSAITFGNFDDPRKISRETIQTWSSILDALPKARLMLIGPEFADVDFAERIHSGFQATGVATERVRLQCPLEKPDEQLRAYNSVDIALDTFPYNGARTTICEALWMGVPVITLTGDRPCARTSTSVLSQVGLERLDSQTTREYVETAVELGGDLDRLRNLRRGMRDRVRVSPLMDERDFARRFEAALRDMWRQWCRYPA